MSIGKQDAICVDATGTTVTSGAVSANVAIPNNSAGVRANVVRLVSTGNVYVHFTNGAGTCTVNDVMLAANLDTYVNCKNYDNISYLQETVAAKINITPLEA